METNIIQRLRQLQESGELERMYKKACDETQELHDKLEQAHIISYDRRYEPMTI